MASVLEEMAQAVIDGDGERVAELVKTALSEKVAPSRIINDGLVAGMGVVGERFKNGEFFIPEVLMSARAMHVGMALVKPLLGSGEEKGRGTIVICTVKGDVHDIGKNLVAMMLEGGGFRVVDLGTDVLPERAVAAVREHSAQVLAMSSLLTTTLARMPETIKALEAAGLRGRVKVMVGGAPVTQAFADRAGADGYAPDAALAVELARRLLGL
ncbi:MAG: cobalamin-binding protein [Euryarchaeota archaeon]|nr:cobalamin-binding protein [Euryarchaeota archaeon]